MLGPLIVLIFGFIMNVTKDFMLETMARAEALVHFRARVADARREAAASSSAGKAEAAKNALRDVPEEDYLVSSARTFEVTDLFYTFLGPRARGVSHAQKIERMRARERAASTSLLPLPVSLSPFLFPYPPQGYILFLSGYMYAALWAYSTVFASSFAANVPVFFLNGGQTCNIEESGSGCLGPFFVWLAVFALFAVPLSCLELKEQVAVQVLMFVARLAVVLMMTGTVLAGYGCAEGTVFAGEGVDYRASTPLFDPNGLATVMPVSIYAFIFHHSVPILSQPVADKRSLPRVFRYAFLIVGGAYVSLGLILAVYFGSDVAGQCNLKWRDYVGCVSPHADGSPVTIADQTAFAKVVSFVILIFPALDVLSAYPLNAITLGNNLLSACYGHADREEEEAAAREAALRGRFACSRFTLRRIAFRLLAAVPPVVAGALSTLYGINLTQILSFAGLIGVGIAFGIPSLLRMWSFARHRAAVDFAAEGIAEESDGAAAAAAGGGKGDAEAAVEAVADAALGTTIGPKDAVRKEAGDAALAKTPYTNVVLRLFRADHALFVFAVGIALFVLVRLIQTKGNG